MSSPRDCRLGRLLGHLDQAIKAPHAGWAFRRAKLRVLAATRRDLHPLVADGRFLEDLLYRLNVVPIEVPPLRDRVADIPLLVEHFINRFGKRAGKNFQTIDKKSLRAFQSYAWPGNVRELQNVGASTSRRVSISSTSPPL